MYGAEHLKTLVLFALVINEGLKVVQKLIILSVELKKKPRWTGSIAKKHLKVKYKSSTALSKSA